MFDLKIEMPKQKKFAMIPSLNLGNNQEMSKLNFRKRDDPEEILEEEKPGVKINF